MTIRYINARVDNVIRLAPSSAILQCGAAVVQPEKIDALQTESLANLKTAMSNLVGALEIVLRLIELQRVSDATTGIPAGPVDSELSLR